jgi:aspartyl-tRNA(Asn)/glutamyl-tRNA(Gln) amidotransferase subunit C
MLAAKFNTKLIINFGVDWILRPSSKSLESMSVDLATVRKIAGLARIATTDAEAEALVPELNNILGWIEQLGEVDTDGIEPLAAVIPNHLRLREDKVTDGGIRDAVLANAPQAEHGFFAVPKVIE